MPRNFPFIGSQLEVICSTTGVRYRGRLENVDSTQQMISLVNVHHFGSEDRPTISVAPIPAKGALPRGEKRDIYACYIDQLRVVGRGEVRDGTDRATPQRSSTESGNVSREEASAGPNAGGAKMNQALPEVATRRKRPFCPTEELIEISDDDDENTAGAEGGMGTGVADEAPPAVSTTEAASQEEPPADEGARQFTILEIIKQLYDPRGTEVNERGGHAPAAAVAPDSHEAEPKDPSPPVAKVAKVDNVRAEAEPRALKRVRFADRLEYIERSDDEDEPSSGATKPETTHAPAATAPPAAGMVDSPLLPVYFITQVINPKAVGVLVNGEQHPHAPAYIAIECCTLHASRPVVGELWRPRTTATLRRRLPLKRGSSERRRRRRSLRPLVNDSNKLIDEVLLSPGEVESVRRVKIHRQRGRIAATMRDAPFLQDHVELEAAGGVVAGVQLNRQQFEGDTAAYNDLWRGDEVEVDVVRLEADCWVGPRYVLPAALDYENGDGGRAPFTREKLEERRIVRAKAGDCVPIRIRKVPRSE